MRFRAGVYASREITNGCKVLLLRLSDDMSATAIVSIPRSKLAEEFNCRPATITEHITAAKAAGFLSPVRRARPNVTAVYQGLEVRQGVPRLRYGNSDPTEVRQDVPLNGGSEVRQDPTPRSSRQPQAADRLRVVASDDASSDERTAS